MNYRLRKTWAVQASVVVQDQHLCNEWRVTVDMYTNTEDDRQQNIAYERMRYWLFDIMQNSVMIAQDHERLPLYQATGQRVIPFPCEPLDPMIGIMLYSKLATIVEQRLVITEITIDSDHGGTVKYLHHMDEDLTVFETAGWWQDSGPAWHNMRDHRDHKVVNLGRIPEWDELDLAWEQKSDDASKGHVVFAEFKKRAD